jgi:asparagine synthase (glutamine-hydrolysing)
MPGIVGLITGAPHEQAKQQLLAMLESLRHESSYRVGTWIDSELGVYVGWVERDESAACGIPLTDEKRGIALLFSGEDFSDPAVVRRVKQNGHAPTECCRSYLLQLCDSESNFPANLNGRFHGLLVDRKLGTATLFNDRYGMHRLYYHEGKEAFYFAAEAKAILAVRAELRRLDYRGLGELIACGCVLENRSIFDKIYVLAPGSAWTFENRRLQKKGTYFRAEQWEQQSELDPEAYYQELQQVFAKNVCRYFKSSEQIALSLTGGLDTRMMLAWQKPAPGSLPCYTFGGTYRECRDVVVARKVAQACGQTHQVIYLGKEFLERFPHYAERSVYMTDACTLVNRAADLYINERARQIAPVRMTGNYGGEVLRRVVAFKPTMPRADVFRPALLSHIRAAGATYSKLTQSHPLSFAVFQQAPWHHYGLLALEQTQVSLRSPYLDNDFVRTVYRAPRVTLTGNGISLRLIAEGNPSLLRIRTDRGFAGTENWLQALAVQRFMDFTAKAEYAYDYGMPQWVARTDHLLSPLHLERLFLGRHKFAHFRIWYRDNLAEYVREMLLDSRTLSRPYLDSATVQAIVERHLSGKRNYTSEIHQLLTLELVQRLFLEAQ